MKYASNERGIALAVSIFALVVIGTLVAGAFFLGMQEQRVGLNTVKLQQAQAAAEQGADLEVVNWNSERYSRLAVDSSATFGGTLANGPGWFRGRVRRLSRLNYLLTSEGFSEDSTARQQVGMLLRLRPVEFLVNAALETQGEMRIRPSGSAGITGVDLHPSGWSGCGSLAPSLPGIRVPDADALDFGGTCASMSCIDGSVKVQEDTTVTSESMSTLGDLQISELSMLADVFPPVGGGALTGIAPTVTGGVCDKANVRNWGDPRNPSGACAWYFPIVFFAGDAHISGGYGQGVLIVDGSLELSGGFEFYGPVIVSGSFRTTGTGAHVNGGVLAANVSLEDDATLAGNTTVRFSSCALARAAERAAPAFLLQERNWVSAYN